MTGTQVVIVGAKRTAIGNLGGGLASLEAHQLAAPLFRHLLHTYKIAPHEVSEVIMGQILAAGCGQGPARQASISAGVPDSVPAWGINQICGSGLRAVALAYNAIQLGESNIVLCGGMESMSRARHAIEMRNGVKFGNATLIDTMQHDGLTDAFSQMAMGITAENLVDKYNISREAQDAFALSSQHKAEAAIKAGKFVEEILPINVIQKKQEVSFAQDEFPRLGLSLEDLTKLRPAFKKDGSVTAGNASGINDGAAVLLLMSAEEANKRGLQPLATVKSFAQAGVAPEIMGIGPVSATKTALQKAGWKVEDLDLIEANEAFAAQAIAVNQELGWPIDKVNVNGGAIALGHPIGASGARVLVTLLHEMQRRGAKKGLATLCIGGGMGVAMCVER